MPRFLPASLVLGALLAGGSPLGLGQGGETPTAQVTGGGAQVAAVSPTAGAPGAGLAGGLISGDLGRGLDEADRQAAFAAEYRALETGQAGAPVAWRGASGNRFGEVIPGPAYRVNEYSCRDYTHTVTIDGQPQSARGTACREPDGTWRPVT